MNRTYTGETYRNLHIRSKEHVRGLEKSDPNNWMMKHVNKDHNGNKDEAEFDWKVLKKHRKPIQRQLQEAVRIQNKTEEETLNSKSEYLGQRIRRLNIDNKTNQHYCQTCGYESSSVESITEHKEKFHDKVNCECEACEYIAYGTRALREHEKESHENHQVECKHCEHKANKKRGLRGHKKKHQSSTEENCE